MRYSSVRYSHRLSYAQLSQGSLWPGAELWSSGASTTSSQLRLAAQPDPLQPESRWHATRLCPEAVVDGWHVRGSVQALEA